MKVKSANLSTTISQATKALLERFCKQRGVKINFFLEEAILEKLEDEMDSEVINARVHEPLVAWKQPA